MNPVTCLTFLGKAQTQPLTEDRLRHFAEACFRFSPRVGVRFAFPQAIFLETQVTQQTPQTKSTNRLKALARRLGFEIQITQAETAGLALAWALSSPLTPLPAGSATVTDLSVKSLDWILNPFGSERRFKDLVFEWERILNRLGVETIGGFLAVPEKVLTFWFGKKALWAHQTLFQVFARFYDPSSDTDWEVWPDLILDEFITERKKILKTKNQKELEFEMEPLLEACAARLKGRSLRARQIGLTFDLSPEPFWRKFQRKKIQIEMKLDEPLGSSVALKQAIRRSLETLLLKDPVTAIQVEVTKASRGVISSLEFKPLTISKEVHSRDELKGVRIHTERQRQLVAS